MNVKKVLYLYAAFSDKDYLLSYKYSDNNMLIN